MPSLKILRLLIIGGVSALFIVIYFNQLTPTTAIEETTPTPRNGVTAGIRNAELEREISPNAKEVFEVTVDSGHLLQVSIEKGDALLTTLVYDPRGTKVLEHVSRQFEQIELSYPVEVKSIYKIEVQSSERADKRKVKVKIDSTAGLTDTNRKDSEARQEMSQALVLQATWDRAALRQSIPHFESASRIWTSLGDYRNSSEAKMRAGHVFFLLSDFANALKCYQESEKNAAAYRDTLHESLAGSYAARVNAYLGNTELARKTVKHSLDLAKQSEQIEQPIGRYVYGEVLTNFGEILHISDNLGKALEYFDEVEKVAVGNREALARIHLSKGQIVGSLGNSHRAAIEISQALTISVDIMNKALEARAFSAQGIVLLVKGKYSPAITQHTQAREIFRAIGDLDNEAVTFNALGQSYEKLEDYDLALNSYQNAQQIFDSIGSRVAANSSLYYLARMYHRKGHWEQAFELFERCVKQSNATGQRRTAVLALTEIAQLNGERKQYELAEEQYLTVLKYYAGIGDRRSQVNVLNAQGTLYLSLGEKERAAKVYGRALDLSKEMGERQVLIETLYHVANLNTAQGKFDEALRIVQESIKMIESVRADVQSSEYRVSYFSGAYPHYVLCTKILMNLAKLHPGDGFAEAALLISEKTKARLLQDLLVEPDIDALPGRTKELLMRKRELEALGRADTSYLRNLPANEANSAERSEAEGRLMRARAEHQEVEAKLRRETPHLFSQRPEWSLTSDQIKKQLDQQTILLEFSLGEETSYLWLITPESIQSYELPGRKVIEDLAIELSKLVSLRQGDSLKSQAEFQTSIDAADKLIPAQAARLSEVLLGQVATQLGTKRIVVVPDGVLQFIPFDVLPLNHNGKNELLIQTNEVVLWPSISTLITVRNSMRETRETGKLIAVLADPVFSRNDERVKLDSAETPPAAQTATRSVDTRGGFKRLLHAAEEADAIVSTAPRGTTTVVEGFDATREAATRSDIGRHQVIHFATHGFLDPEHPELSGIALSMVDRKGTDTDGLMLLHDIYSLHLSTELTVLSACQTALGKDVRGEGPIGLTHSFLSAGSKSVVASLWKVDDQATAVLMAAFYEGMLQKGMSPAAALRSAKLKLMTDERWSAPYYWAGFVIQGEYANRIVVGHQPWLTPRNAIIGFIGLTIVGSLIFFIVRRRQQSVRNSHENSAAR